MSIDHEVPSPVFPEFDPDDQSSNQSGNRPFREVLAARVSRRDVIRAGSVVGAAEGLPDPAVSRAAPSSVLSSAAPRYSAPA